MPSGLGPKVDFVLALLEEQTGKERKPRSLLLKAVGAASPIFLDLPVAVVAGVQSTSGAYHFFSLKAGMEGARLVTESIEWSPEVFTGGPDREEERRAHLRELLMQLTQVAHTELPPDAVDLIEKSLDMWNTELGLRTP